MQFTTAQQEMVAAHVRGAPGVLVSGLVWLIAGWLWARYGVVDGFYALFIGGMLIFPGSLLISRVLFRAPKASPGNPLERLGLESTFILFAGILLAYCFLRVAPDLAFPAMAVAIGARYFVFRTIYGNPIFWVLGGAIAVVGGLVALAHLTLPVNLALVVGAIEVSFSVVIYLLGQFGRAGKPSAPRQASN
jgi:hypothetical protein